MRNKGIFLVMAACLLVFLYGCGGGGGGNDGNGNGGNGDDPTPVSNYSQLGATVKSLKFYEGPRENVPMEERVYADNFDQDTTRYVMYELNLEYPEPGKLIEFQLDFVCYNPDGSEFSRVTVDFSVQPDWRRSLHTTGSGSNTPGWLPGEYTVKVFDHENNNLLVSGKFTIRTHNGGDDPGDGETTESDVIILGPTDQMDSVTGLVRRPRVRLEHPAGAWADVPESPVLYSEKVDLRKITLPNDSSAWDWGGVGWQFVSGGGLVIADDVTLALPGTGASNETVLALSHTGDWIEIPSTAISLVGGKAGRQVEIGNVPIPWILVVARPTGNSAVPEVTLSQELERLYWTNRAEWEYRTLDAVSDILFADTPPEPEFLMSAAPAVVITSGGLSADLDKAYAILGSARYGGVLDLSAAGTPLPVIGLSPFALYLEGLDRLAAVREKWQRNKTRLQAEWPDFPYSTDQTLEQAIESALAYYAPWGIDITRFLLHTGTLGAFDMRVIGPYGELLYADAPLTNTHENKTIGIDIARLAGQGVTANCYLRLYSRVAMQDTWVDWLKDWKIQTVVRWAPALLVTAGIVSGAATPALLFAAADQVISFVQDHYSEDSPSVYLNLESASASTGTVGAYFADEATQIFGFDSVPTSSVGMGLNVAQTVYSIALLYGVGHTDWYMLKEVRPLTNGTRSYCPKGNCVKSWWTGDYIPIEGYDQVPPIQVVAVLQDSPPGHPVNGYPATRIRMQVWTMPLPRYGADLHRLYVNGGFCEAVSFGMQQDVLCQKRDNWNGGIKDLPFEAYKKELWPEVTTHTAPAAQSMRLSLPKTVLNQIAADWDLGASPSPADYGLYLRVAAPDGSRAIFTVDDFLDPLPGESTNNVYFQILIEGMWKGGPADLRDMDPEYDGIRGKMNGGALQTKLKIEVFAHSGDDPCAEGNIDFTAKEIKNIEIYPGYLGYEQFQFAKVALVNKLKYDLVFYQSDNDWFYENEVFGTRFSPDDSHCISTIFTVNEADKHVPDGVYILFKYPDGSLMFDIDQDELYPLEDGDFKDGGTVWQADYGLCGGFWSREAEHRDPVILPVGMYRVDVLDKNRSILISRPFEIY